MYKISRICDAGVKKKVVCAVWADFEWVLWTTHSGPMNNRKEWGFSLVNPFYIKLVVKKVK